MDENIQSSVISHAQSDLANVPGASGRFESVQEPTSSAPSTESLLMSEFRRGLKDLQNAVLDPWNGVTATHEEIGTIANPTQIEVNQDRGVYGPEAGAPDQERAAYDAQLDAAAAGYSPQQSMEIER